MFNTERVDVISPDECMVDSTFVWSDNINVFLRDNTTIKNRYIIYASFLMDFMLLSFMAFFFLYWSSYRIMLSYIMFFGMRTVIQVSIYLFCLPMLDISFLNRKHFLWAGKKDFYSVTQD